MVANGTGIPAGATATTRKQQGDLEFPAPGAARGFGAHGLERLRLLHSGLEGRLEGARPFGEAPKEEVLDADAVEGPGGRSRHVGHLSGASRTGSSRS